MAKHGPTDDEKSAVQLQLRRWKDELGTQQAVADRVGGFTQQAIGQALKYGAIGFDLANRVALAAGYRSLSAFVDALGQTDGRATETRRPRSCLTYVRGVELEALPASLRALLEGDGIPERVRDAIPALVAMRYANGETMTEADWLREAEFLYRRGVGEDLLKAAEPPAPPYMPEPDPVAERKATRAKPTTPPRRQR